ncbi:MAG: hypothetical protein LBD41_06810 [Clostridiales Family XIII bacterium]|jgi:hypothetical protein|nr:hypothetical protein [Clostridiales Family XIII bacterium]
MNKNIKCFINTAVKNIISRVSSEDKLKLLHKKHTCKVHFIPENYRVFGGVLQSMNIQFGNFIEELMQLIIENENTYEIINEFSGKKSNNFDISSANSNYIDNYIDNCQIHGEKFCDNNFQLMQNELLKPDSGAKNIFKHDIDLLFRNKKTDTYYYLEIKYNDDHDTGKFIDINRKFIKTYAFLISKLDIKKVNQLVPIIFYFTSKTMKGNIYVPESTNILRGKAFFDKFIKNISYDELNKYLTEISESAEMIKMFNELYGKVVNPPAPLLNPAL